MRPESWTPPDDGPLLFDRDHTRWGACGDCGEAPVYYRTHRCAPTVPPEPATRRPSLFSRLRTLRLRSPIVPAQRAPHQTNERTAS